MKDLTITTIFLLLFQISLFAQEDVQRVASVPEITWYGLDFSNLKVVGDIKSGTEIANTYFNGWNYLVNHERKKYDLGKAFRKKTVYYDLEMMTELNQQRDPDEVVGHARHEITEDQLAAQIKEYKVTGSGVGLVFVVENFDKFSDEGTMWVTFFDIDTKRVLMARKMTGKAGGFGFRNYWARTIYNVIVQSGKDYRRWIK